MFEFYVLKKIGFSMVIWDIELLGQNYEFYSYKFDLCLRKDC